MMRNHSGNFGFIKKMKNHIGCVWHGSILPKTLGTDQQFCCNNLWHEIIMQHSQTTIRVYSVIKEEWPHYSMA
jgi:hypothetical protein